MHALSLGGTEPGSLSTSSSLLCYFRLLVVDHGFSYLETMKCALSHGPLSFPFSLSVVLFGSESSLHQHEHWNEERNNNEWSDKFVKCKCFWLDLVLKHVVPSLAWQCQTNDELKDVKRNVSKNAEDPDCSCPSPTNSIDPRKVPVCIHSNHSCHLIHQFPDHK